MWESPPDWVSKFFAEELEARVPRSILECKEISREVNFSSAEKMVVRVLLLSLRRTSDTCLMPSCDPSLVYGVI